MEYEIGDKVRNLSNGKFGYYPINTGEIVTIDKFINENFVEFKEYQDRFNINSFIPVTDNVGVNVLICPYCEDEREKEIRTINDNHLDEGLIYITIYCKECFREYHEEFICK